MKIEVLRPVKLSAVLLSFIFLLHSCAAPVVSRPAPGVRATSGPPQGFDGIKRKAALLTFFNESPHGGDELAAVATEEIRRELSRTGHFLIDPMGGRIFGDSRQVFASGGANLAQMAQEAKVAGIHFVIYGRVVSARVRERTDEIGLVRQTTSFSEAQVEIRVFDVNSNKEIFSDTLRGHAEDQQHRFFIRNEEERLAQRREMLRYSVRVATRRSIPQIISAAEKLDWVGRVARIVGNKIYINAGRQSGIHIGDILKVLTAGQEIYDPETGALLGISRGEIKGTLEVIDYFGADGSIAVLHSGGSVHEADFVMLY